MDELNLIKNILSLKGTYDPNVRKTISVIETVNKITQNGMNEEYMYSLLACINPKIVPLVNIMKSENNDKEKEKENKEFVQYNRPE